MQIIEAQLTAPDARIAIVAGRWHTVVVDGLLAGAMATLKANGVKEENITLVRAPGAFEIPLVAKKVAAQKKHDAIIALGVVIRGDTPHFEYVAGSCVNGIAQISLDYDVPVAFGVLTVNTDEQAINRIGGRADIGHKGVEAASAALEMINVLKQL